MEDGAGIPEEFRCKRSDGKQWRCSARSMPDKTVCEKHYVQAKRRAANSAMRANEKKARRKLPPVDAAADDAYLDATGREDDFDEASGSPIAAVCSSGGGGDYSGGPSPAKRYKERTHKGQGAYFPGQGRVKGGPSARSRHGEDAQRDLLQDSRLRETYSTPRMRKSTKGFGGGGLEVRRTLSHP